MKLYEILRDRSCGFLQVKSIKNYDFELSLLLKRFKLKPKSDHLIECDITYALEVLKTILWKDLAYSSELISEPMAKERANYLISQFSDDQTLFYTNGDWKDYHTASTTNGWSSLTESTFDGGIILVNKTVCSSIWVQDED